MTTQAEFEQQYNIGRTVKAKVNIIQEASEDGPALLFAKEGEELIIRGHSDPRFTLNIKVSHPEITDSAFYVSATEIELY